MSKLDSPLGSIPDGLRIPLIQAYNEIERNFREQRWEPSELNGGKLCEIVYTIIKGHVDGTFAASPSKPNNFVDSCRDFEKADKTKFSQAVRITIPRMLVSLYEIRNNRGVGHTGAEVNPNHMDATVVLSCSKWIMSDLVRHFHKVDVSVAAKIVDDLVERTNPYVWQVGDVRRVLRPGMMRDKTLLLLHSSPASLHEDQLFSWVEHTNRTNYRKDVLIRLHREKLAEYDEVTRTVTLSPLGIADVEDRILKELEKV